MSFIWLTASWCDMIIFFILLMESIQRQLLDFTSFCLWNSVSAALLMEAIRRQLFDFVIIFSSVCLLKFSFCICKKKKKKRPVRNYSDYLEVNYYVPVINIWAGLRYCVSILSHCINTFSNSSLITDLNSHSDAFLWYSLSHFLTHNWLNSVLKLKNITLVLKWNTDVWV